MFYGEKETMLNDCYYFYFRYSQIVYATPAMSTKGKTTCSKSISFISRNESNVYQSLLGTCYLYNDLTLLKNHRIVFRKDHSTMYGKVKILAGGGAGLEPAETGYIGPGMLTGVVLGEIFTAPPANSILIAIRELAYQHEDGILLLVKNYIGDVLNFGLALEQAVKENITVKMLLIGDDSAKSEPGKYGRRGSAGSVLIYKIVGAMAENGKSLDDIVNICKEKILTDISTVSLCLSPSSEILWHTAEAGLEDEAIFGIGLYGQPGIQKKYRSLQDSVRCMIDLIEKTTKKCEVATSENINEAQVVLLINNLGAVSKFEEGVICAEIVSEFEARNYTVVRIYAGTFMPLLNSKGFSLTVLGVTYPETLVLLDQPTTAFNWPKSNMTQARETKKVSVTSSAIVGTTLDHDGLDNARYEKASFGPAVTEGEKQIIRQIISFAAEALISCEKQINVIDLEVGDGDAGTMLKNGAEVIIKALESGEINLSHPFKTLNDLANIINKTVGGITGALYFVFFSAASKAFLEAKNVDRKAWCEAFRLGVRAVKCYGKAEIGERTLLDVLHPAAEIFETSIRKNNDISRIASSVACAVEYYAEETKKVKPYTVRGRYPKKELFYADAGAHAVAVWVRAVSEGVKLNYPE